VEEAGRGKDAGRNVSGTRSTGGLQMQGKKQSAEESQDQRLHQLRDLERILTRKKTRKQDFIPEYGDLSLLNKDGLISTLVDKEQLGEIVSEYLDLLETSAAVYERGGDYALGIFSSGWCRMMDSASRGLCRTKDNRKALASGKWLCHESCWKEASLPCIQSGRPVEVECNGGIKLYAVRVRAGGEIVGAMNFGFGEPPENEKKLRELSEKYRLPVKDLRKQATAYQSRPPFIIDYAKSRIQKSADYLGHIIERRQAEMSALRRHDEFLSILNGIDEPVYVSDPETWEVVYVNRMLKELFGPVDGRKCYEYLQQRKKPCPFCTNGKIFGEHAGRSYVWEFRNETNRRFYKCIDRAIPWPDGRMLRLEIAVDITERKLAEKRIEHLNLVLRTIRDINQLIVRERDRETLIREICRLLVANRGYLSALIVLTDNRNRPVFWASYGMASAFNELNTLLEKEKLPPCLERVRSEEGALLVHDRNAICGNCPIVHGYSESQSLCAPLNHKGKTFGYLAAAAETGLTVDEEEVSLFCEMAEDIAFALHVMEIEKARQKAEAELRKSKENLEIQVDRKTRELQVRVAELERFHDATVEREFRIKELRDEIERLREKKKNE